MHLKMNVKMAQRQTKVALAEYSVAVTPDDLSMYHFTYFNLLIKQSTHSPVQNLYSFQNGPMFFSHTLIISFVF